MNNPQIAQYRVVELDATHVRVETLTGVLVTDPVIVAEITARYFRTHKQSAEAVSTDDAGVTRFRHK